MNVRVIAGKARRLVLKTPEGMDTRPTTDRIKETLFNMINPLLYDASFLDLFSGSGGMAIEALSRGARTAVLVENNRKAAECIRMNLKTTGLDSQAELLTVDVMNALDRLERAGKEFDLIFMDPPYGEELEKQVLERLKDSCLAGEDTLIIAEASLETAFDYLDGYGYKIERVKKYKTNQHVFIKRKQTEEEEQ